MDLTQILLIPLAANLDNIGVGMAYGVKRVGISQKNNLIISLISLVDTAFFGYLGHYITYLIPLYWAKIIGSLLLILVGIWVGTGNYQRKRKMLTGWWEILLNPKEASFRNARSITWGETVLLGIALSINSMVGGFSAGIQGTNPLLIAVSIAIFSYLFLTLGLHIGQKYASGFVGENSNYLAGALLILIGVYQFLV